MAIYHAERLEETQEALKQAVGGQSPDRSPDQAPDRGMDSFQPPPTGEEGGKAEEKNPGMFYHSPWYQYTEYDLNMSSICSIDLNYYKLYKYNFIK